MRYTTLGFPIPEADDCAACVFGYEHNVECIGVLFEGTRVYRSGMPSVGKQAEETWNRWLT